MQSVFSSEMIIQKMNHLFNTFSLFDFVSFLLILFKYLKISILQLEMDKNRSGAHTPDECGTVSVRRG